MLRRLIHLSIILYLLISLDGKGQTPSGNKLYDEILTEFRQIGKHQDTIGLFDTVDSLISVAMQESNCVAATMGYYVKAYVLRKQFLGRVNNYLMAAYIGENCDNSKIHLQQMASIFFGLGLTSTMYNEYDLAIQFYEEGLDYAYPLSDTSQIVQLIYAIGNTYFEKGDYYQSLLMHHREKPYQESTSWRRTRSEILIGNALCDLGKLDEALEVEKALILKLKSDTTHYKWAEYTGYLYNNIGNVFTEKLEVDSAIYYYEKSFLLKERMIGTNLNRGFIVGSISSLAELYLERQDFKKAKKTLQKGIKYIEGGDDQNFDNNTNNLEVYQQLIQLYKALGKEDSVNLFKEKYQNQLDRYTEFTKERNVQALVDKFYAEREKEELEARNQEYLFWFLVSLASASFLGGGIFIFQRRRSIRTIAVNQSDKRLAEVKALKAQINPHFLFNSLNSIYSFILEEKSEDAEEYLLKYGKLIRKILDHSNTLTVSLTDELETLKLYVDLERLRLGYDFAFEIAVNLDTLPDETFFPSMILQPFIENAIWHGIADLQADGKINLTIDQKDDLFHVVISDNGGGITETQKHDRQVRGIDLIRERLSLLFDSKTHEEVIDIDSSSNGTRVSLKFPMVMVEQSDFG